MRTRTIAVATAVCCFVIIATAYAGAPLKGVDVKLGKNPGGSPAARGTSDHAGKVDFGVLPAGSYQMTLGMPPHTGTADVEITGAIGGTIRKRWDFRSNKAYDAGGAAARGSAQPNIVIDADGKQPVQTTIVRAKSNISNN